LIKTHQECLPQEQRSSSAPQAVSEIGRNMIENILGWTVRVIMNGKYVATYAAGFPSHVEAQNAVKDARDRSGEDYLAVDQITEKHGPKIGTGEVREV
jgi:hypothetical protein